MLIVGCSVTATLGALAFDLTQYSRFLYLLGAFFVPLFGVLLADWIQRGMHYTRADVFEGPAVRPGMIFAWLCGFLFYEWLATSTGATADLGFWTSFLDAAASARLADRRVAAELRARVRARVASSGLFARRAVVATAEG